MDDTKETHPSENTASDGGRELFGSVPTDPPKGRRYIFAGLIFIITVSVVYQTRVCTVLMGRLRVRPSALAREVQESKRLQEEVRKASLKTASPNPQPVVVPHPLFFGSNSDRPGKGKLISDTVNSILGDQTLCDSFPSLDGIRLEQTAAIIVPLWRVQVAGDRERMGITEAGFVCSDDDSTLSPSALTIREKPTNKGCVKRLQAASVKYVAIGNDTPQMTADGIARIALTEGVLERPFDLKLTLIHEFMHVHAAPGYRPLFNIVHDDLTYIPEYTEMLRRAGLSGSTNRQELILWLFTGIGLLLIAVNIYRAAW